MTFPTGHAGVPEEIIEKVSRLHAEVDSVVIAITNRLENNLTSKLECRKGCHACCEDGLKVFPVEAALIMAHAPDLLASGKPNTGAGCAFLDNAGACRIYPWRPYVCRTQGLPLRWLEEDQTGETVELRDICPLNEETLQSARKPLEDLSPDLCWTIGDIESRLAGLQASVSGFSVELPRIPLRDFFESGE